jgi:putative transposase
MDVPKFRKKGLQDSFRFPAPKQIQLDYNRIKLSKIGWLRFFRSQAVEGELKNITVSKKSKDWFVSIQVEKEKIFSKLEKTTTENQRDSYENSRYT